MPGDTSAADKLGGMVTLPDFLLARIAEDEAMARKIADPQDEPSWWCDEQTNHLAVSPARVLAECEAKRAIVERCRPVDRTLLLDAPESARAAWDVIDTLSKATLRDLALPYADHPDCREEWKP